MTHLGNKLSHNINLLDSILDSLKIIQEAFEQAKEKFKVDDYYDILISLDRAREIKEKLSMVVQRQGLK